MLKKVEEWIEKWGMLPEHSSVIAAVSGGADSVCLLAVLLYLAPAHDWKVRALHVNHLIRGDEAQRDEDFVRDLCRKWQTDLTVVHIDVPAYARKNKLSLEEAGRICRRRTLEYEARNWEDSAADLTTGGVKIAMAHQKDDNAETILHNLLRGSGLRGLGGICPADGKLIHPLLCVRREEVRDFLEENKIPWCDDSTNADTTYTRNRIRNDIIPLMEKEVNSHAVENIARAGDFIAQADKNFYSMAEDIFCREGKTKKNGVQIKLSAFLEQDPLMRSYIIRYMLDIAAPNLRDMTSRHFDMIMKLAAGKTGKRVNLPGGVVAGRDYDILWIGCPGEDYTGCASAFSEKNETIWEPVPEGGRAAGISFTVLPHQNGEEIPKNKWSKWFDYDKISGALSVRTRRSGDYLTIAGGARKSLSRLFIDEKVPRDERDEILLLAEGSHILWVVGLRISEYYKVTEETTRILQAEKEG